jgi:cytochrome c peroxidase
MNPGIPDLMVFGLAAVMTAALILLALVHFELGPSVHLAKRKRWLLAAVLGLGVLTFVGKLLMIFIFVSFPQLVAEPLKERLSPAVQPSTVPIATDAPHYVRTALPQRNRDSTTVAQQLRERYIWQALPEQAPAPVHNPTTPEKAALGEQLFLDPALSHDGTVSCASCHDVNGLAGADGRATARGIGNQMGARNAPTVWNAAFQSVLFWDGRAASLEEQAKGPLVNPLEMGMPSLTAVEERVRQDPRYKKAFARAFGSATPITIDRIAEAIAAYERNLITPDTPYDRFVRGEPDAMTSAQLRGMALFQSLGCNTCHQGPNFSAASIFDPSMPRRIFPANPTPYEKRYDLLSDTGAAGGKARGVWRVPSLRNVALTGPWLHNGAVTELEEVIRIMASAQLGRTGRYLLWSKQGATLREIDVAAPSDDEVADIVAFLNALSSDTLAARHKQIKAEK